MSDLCRHGVCEQQALMVGDKNSETYSAHHPRESSVSFIGKHLRKHKSGLCYYHLKKAVGLFEMSYPLESPSTPAERMWDDMPIKPAVPASKSWL